MKEGEEKRAIEEFTGKDMSALESALDVLSRAATMVQEEGPKSTDLHRRPSNARRKERRIDPVQNEALDMSTSKNASPTFLRPSVIMSSTSQSADTSANLNNWDSFSRPRSSTPSATGNLKKTSSIYDPAIEEHFKRSLGAEKYAAVFKPTEADKSIGLSVDDHFAKSLGDQWTKLKQPVDRSHRHHQISVPAKSVTSFSSVQQPLCCCSYCVCNLPSS